MHDYLFSVLVQTSPVRRGAVNSLGEVLAWVDRQKCRAVFCRRWLIQEHQAVLDKRGIWGLNIGTPPWQWSR